jgi:hypothetical protein
MQALAVAISDAPPGAEVGITFTERVSTAGLLVLYQCCSTSPGAVAGFLQKIDDAGHELDLERLTKRVDRRARDLVGLKLRSEHTPESVDELLGTPWCDPLPALKRVRANSTAGAFRKRPKSTNVGK